MIFFLCVFNEDATTKAQGYERNSEVMQETLNLGLVKTLEVSPQGV